MIYMNEDALDDLSQMGQQTLNPTALNFREIAPQVHSNYDDVFNRNKLDNLASKIAEMYPTKRNIYRDSMDPDEPTWTPGSTNAPPTKEQLFAWKIKDSINRRENWDDESHPFESPTLKDEVHNIYDRVKEAHNNIQPNQDDPSLADLAMAESTTIDRDTVNLIYNYGKSELQKDIFAFGKKYVV